MIIDLKAKAIHYVFLQIIISSTNDCVFAHEHMLKIPKHPDLDLEICIPISCCCDRQCKYCFHVLLSPSDGIAQATTLSSLIDKLSNFHQNSGLCLEVGDLQCQIRVVCFRWMKDQPG